MIHRGDVEATLRARTPEVTDTDVTSLYETMLAEWSDLSDRIARQTRTKWTTHHGHQPDGLSWGQIQERAKYQAELEIRGRHLDPITEEIVAREEDQEIDQEDDLYQQTLRTPGQWRKTPGHVHASLETRDLVKDLWEEESATFWMYAEALIEHLKFTGQKVPRTRAGERYEEVTHLLREAEVAYIPYQPRS